MSQGPGGETPSREERWVWADLIRVLALFLVVLLHAAAVPATRFGQLPLDWWWAAHLLDSLVRPCVPLFVMVSGALLLDPARHEPLGHFVRRRLAKVVLPLLAWSAGYALWRIGVHGHEISWARFGRHLVQGMGDPVYPHLWFLFLIASLYLVTPIFRVYVSAASRSNLLYFACLWFLATAIRPWVERWTGMTIGLTLEPVTGFIGYFVLGVALPQLAPGRLRGRAIALWSGVAAVAYAITVLGTWVLTARQGALDESLYSYLAPNVIAMSVAAYLLLRDAGLALTQRGGDSAPARWLATASLLGLGAYVLHAALLEIVERVAFGPVSFHPAFAVPLLAAVAFLASLAITALLRRIPGFRFLLP